MRKKLFHKLGAYWAIALCRRALLPCNVAFFRLACQLIGVNNWQSPAASGEARVLRKLAPQCKVVFDVGANNGDYSRQVLRQNPQAAVYAFEAQPKNFEALQQLQGIHAVPLAVGNRDGEATLYDYGDQNTEHACMFPELFSGFYSYGSPLRSFLVNMTTLDTFCKDRGLDHIDFLKIDVEGAEYDVLLGCQELLAKRAIHVIQFEFNIMNVYTRHFMRDFESLLKGYKLFRLCPTSLYDLAVLPTVCKEVFAYQNILAVETQYVADIVKALA